MLNLKQNGTVIKAVVEGAWFTLPNGSHVSPAYAGWTDGVFYMEVAPEHAVETPSGGVTGGMVNAERDRRMRGTFTFGGKEYDCDQTSLQRITGAASLAGFWMAAGGDPQSNLWHGGVNPFLWISHDNAANVMTAATVFAFGQAAAHNETAHIFAARALKDMNPIPADYASDAYWP